MRGIEYRLLRRFIELLVLVELYNVYGVADSIGAAWTILCNQNGLGRIGTVTCLIIIGSAVVDLGTDVARLLRFCRGLMKSSGSSATPIAFAPAGATATELQAMRSEKIDEGVNLLGCRAGHPDNVGGMKLNDITNQQEAVLS